ncbi:MAG: PKD domain-containing protein [Candidatus Bipolaricaulota bacterium]|nr:PKD domain-containing protein [Candidatus Bipolaricaulota bacterium]
MRRWLLVALAVGMMAPAAFGVVIANNQHLDDDWVSPGDLVVAQHVIVYTGASPINSVLVLNTAGGSVLKGSDIERIEVVRVNDDRVIGSQASSKELAKLTTTGVSISIGSSYRAFTGDLEFVIRIKLKSTVALGTVFALGGTHVYVHVTVDNTETDVYYAVGNEAAVFTVGPLPTVAFDGLMADDETYHGERFLAGRINVDAGDVPFNFTISQVVLTNKALIGTLLSGSSIARIEIRRASDGALLGEQTTDTELSKLTTTGCKVTTPSSNEASAYGMTQLEIWVTLEASVPVGRKLQFEAKVRCGGTDFAAGDGLGPAVDAPVFTSTQAAGFETVTNLSLDGGQIYSGQRFLAQRIEVSDSDVAPFDVTITSLVIQNVADSVVRLAENQVVRIEVVRARDGAVMGSVTGASGLNGGGVRVTTSSSNVVTDDSSEILEIWITLGASVPDDRVLQVKSVIWHSEDGTTFGHVLPDAGPEFITGPAVGEGFETATSSTDVASRTVLSGGRFLAQRLVLTDSDADPYDVTVASVMIRNVVGDNWLADQNVARLEVRRKSDGALLGEVVDPVGLSLAGVRVTASGSNTVPDDSAVTLEIWVTLKLTAPAGRKLELESIVWHTEGIATFQTAALAGPAIFTTKVGTSPSNVDFTWTPAAPKYNQEITFTPAATIADPEGAIAKATYSWNFGDGGTASTTGTAAVKHTYTGGGSFSVVLTVTGEAGLSSSRTNAVAVEGPPNVAPTATFTWTPQAPAQTQTVTFTSAVTDPDQPTGTAFTYAWDFGDTATSTVANPQHAFATKQTYTVKLIVTDAQSASVTVEHTISVGNTPPTIATLTANPTSPNTGDTVTFTVSGATDADADDTVSTFKWTFGDGTPTVTTTATPQGGGTATHTFNAAGAVTVSVIAVDSRGGESLPKIVTVTVSGPTRVILYAYPNPASALATFNLLLLDGTTNPVLRIFRIDGRLMLEEELGTGTTTYPWNLLDSAGDPVGNGLYFCIVTGTAAAGGTVRSDVFRLLIVR